MLISGLHFVSNNETSNKTYQVGVDLGIINPGKYPFSSFQRDEQNVFKDLYNEYISLNSSLPINYEDWLVLNNFGVLSDTQESMLQRKISKRSTADNKREFFNTVRKGDILVSSGGGSIGLIGHAAIMTSDYWVLEMPGTKQSLEDNNRQVPKDKWFDEHASDWTTVYRCPDNSIARKAAGWADTHYYDASGGEKKTIHIRYSLFTDIWSINPSYCSKLVIQAYYYGTGSAKVITDLSIVGKANIVPSLIPSYFLSPYKLINKGRY